MAAASDEVFVPDVHPVHLAESDLLEQCLIRRTRHSGPGGQHRNKVETAIEIVHLPSQVVAFAAEQRSQDINRREAIFRLRLLLAVRIRSRIRDTVEPSQLWISRCRDGRIACNERHQDFPVLLAEALDAVNSKDFDVRKAAAALGCSPSQMIRFLAKCPEALTSVNSVRTARGLHRLMT
jgi:hypothetical protein